MNVNLTPSEFRLLRNYIEENCGISLSEGKAYLIETRLGKVMLDSGCTSFYEFYRLITEKSNRPLRDKVVDAMTTQETLWFRDNHPYAILNERLLPEFAERIRDGKQSRIRIWSAGASTGQEPYSIAITVHEYCEKDSGIRKEHFDILATDISPKAIAIAEAGRYDSIAMKRGLSNDCKERYFEKNDGEWILDCRIRNMVRFDVFNLQDTPVGFGKFDIVFLRNVAIYFSVSLKRTILSNLTHVLSPGGYLVLGAVESLFGLSEDFESLSCKGGTFYRCRT